MAQQLPSYWQPDEEAAACRHCASPFTLLRRRHHCRACGLLFCGACAPARDGVLSGGRFLGQRVCVPCWARAVDDAVYLAERQQAAAARARARSVAASPTGPAGAAVVAAAAAAAALTAVVELGVDAAGNGGGGRGRSATVEGRFGGGVRRGDLFPLSAAGADAPPLRREPLPRSSDVDGGKGTLAGGGGGGAPAPARARRGAAQAAAAAALLRLVASLGGDVDPAARTLRVYPQLCALAACVLGLPRARAPPLLELVAALKREARAGAAAAARCARDAAAARAALRAALARAPAHAEHARPSPRRAPPRATLENDSLCVSRDAGGEGGAQVASAGQRGSPAEEGAEEDEDFQLHVFGGDTSGGLGQSSGGFQLPAFGGGACGAGGGMRRGSGGGGDAHGVEEPFAPAPLPLAFSLDAVAQFEEGPTGLTLVPSLLFSRGGGGGGVAPAGEKGAPPVGAPFSPASPAQQLLAAPASAARVEEPLIFGTEPVRPPPPSPFSRPFPHPFAR
jgi:hypothetical protein